MPGVRLFAASADWPNGASELLRGEASRCSQTHLRLEGGMGKKQRRISAEKLASAPEDE